MIDLMLKDSGVPTICDDGDGLGPFVQAIDPDAHRAGHQRRESTDTETTFKKLRYFGIFDCQFRVDQDMKRNLPSAVQSAATCSK